MILAYVARIATTQKKEVREMAKPKNQMEAIKKYLIRYKKISSWKAIQLFGCTRLSAKIFDLRCQGWEIRSVPVSKKNRYGLPVTFTEYHLISKTPCNSKTIIM